MVGGGDQALQRDEVNVHVRIEGDPRALDTQAALADRSPQHRQRPAQRSSGSLVVDIRPEHRGQFVPGERPPLRRDEGDDRQRLPGIHDRGSACDHDLEGTQQADLEQGLRVRHRVTVLRDGYIS